MWYAKYSGYVLAGFRGLTEPEDFKARQYNSSTTFFWFALMGQIFVISFFGQIFMNNPQCYPDEAKTLRRYCFGYTDIKPGRYYEKKSLPGKESATEGVRQATVIYPNTTDARWTRSGFGKDKSGFAVRTSGCRQEHLQLLRQMTGCHAIK
jgi:hypothetical protein